MLVSRRMAAQSWRSIVESEPRPLVVETLTVALERLSGCGSKFRRAEAAALHRDGMSIEVIASLFGVTRQRVSALLRTRDVARQLG
jgi:hypothetical protein